MYLYYMEFTFFKSVFNIMTLTVEGFRQAVLALDSSLNPDKRCSAIAEIFDQLTDNGNS